MRVFKKSLLHAIIGICMGLSVMFCIKFGIDSLKISRYNSVEGVFINTGSVDKPNYSLSYTVNNQEYLIDMNNSILYSPNEDDIVRVYFDSADPSTYILYKTTLIDLTLLCWCMISFILFKCFE